MAYYLRNPNATNAARLAGYKGNDITLASTGYEILRNPHVQAELERLRKARRLTPGAVLDMIEGTATVDLTPYIREDMTLDVDALSAAGLGYLVEGVKPGRNGPEITLASPQTARKMLARHHRLVGAQVEIDQSTNVQLDPDMLGSLVDQLAAAAQTQPTEQDDTE